MANHKSALKRIRQNEKRRQYNTDRRNRVRSFVKRVRADVANTSEAPSVPVLREAIQELDRAVNKGVIHPNNAARRKSRLMRQFNVAAAAAAAAAAAPARKPKAAKKS
jgi:small subunit ribosomal protein S20